MKPPKDLKELQSFMGMVNYLNRFSPVIAQIAEPIRNLMKRDAPFIWQTEQQRAFQQIKDTISKSPLLAYYDPEKESVIQSDASMHGLGCVLLQDGKPVCYASRSLTDTESRYSNIERESYLQRAGPSRNSTTTFMARRQSSRQTINHLRVFGRKA
jgi:hypothetical protein